ncbi:MAG: hypothetical protein PHW04_01575 [Candidatus Wallbacteria bacterium]|nr:hypothetical protein [Candidatus Wallbacteria bacterium]
MHEELILNSVYLSTVMVCGVALFLSLGKSEPERWTELVSYYNNLFFGLGLAIFIGSLFVLDFSLQTILILISSGMILFMFYSNGFVYLAERYFGRTDFRLYSCYFVFQVLLILYFEMMRGTYTLPALKQYFFG